MKSLSFLFVLLCVVSAPLQAQDVWQWFGTDQFHSQPPSTNWLDGHNWYKEGTNPGDPGILIWPDLNIPGAHDKAKINNVQWGQNWDQYGPIIGGENGVQNVPIGDVFIAEGGAALSPMHMTVAQGGTFNVLGAGGTAEGQINIGYQAGAVGAFYVEGGVVNVNGPVHVGWGGDGALTINSGSMTVSAIDIGGNLGTGIITVNNGQLIVAGNVAGQLQEYKNNGDLIGIISYDAANNRTIVTPEPASIALLGLGLVFLKKRK